MLWHCDCPLTKWDAHPNSYNRNSWCTFWMIENWYPIVTHIPMYIYICVYYIYTIYIYTIYIYTIELHTYIYTYLHMQTHTHINNVSYIYHYDPFWNQQPPEMSFMWLRSGFQRWKPWVSPEVPWRIDFCGSRSVSTGKSKVANGWNGWLEQHFVLIDGFYPPIDWWISISISVETFTQFRQGFFWIKYWHVMEKSTHGGISHWRCGGLVWFEASDTCG